MNKTVIVCALLFVGVAANGETRGRHYSPEKLKEISTLVFTGKVLEIETDQKYKVSFPSKAQVTKVIKGELKEKELSFPHKNPGRCVIFKQEYNVPVKGDEGTFYFQMSGDKPYLVGYIKKQKTVCGDRGLKLTISVPDKSFEAGRPVPMTFDITNTGSREISIPPVVTYAKIDKGTKLPHIGSGTYIICQNRSGEFLKFKGWRAKIGGVLQGLKPGEKVKAYTLDLSKCFDLKPGMYDVQLLFTSRYSGFIDGASNRITLKVTKE